MKEYVSALFDAFGSQLFSAEESLHIDEWMNQMASEGYVFKSHILIQPGSPVSRVIMERDTSEPQHVDVEKITHEQAWKVMHLILDEIKKGTHE